MSVIAFICNGVCSKNGVGGYALGQLNDDFILIDGSIKNGKITEGKMTDNFVELVLPACHL